MLVLAGCSTGSNPGTGASVEPQEPTTGTVASEESSEMIDPEYGPEDGQNLTEYSNDLGSDAAGLTRSERKQVEDLVVGFMTICRRTSQSVVICSLIRRTSTARLKKTCLVLPPIDGNFRRSHRKVPSHSP